jgi:cytochrome c oxidase subunit 4
VNHMRRNTPAGLRPCTWVWLAMMALTLATWAIGRWGSAGLGPSLLVLGFALLKGQLVGDGFMGLRRVRGFWRWPVTLWLVVPGALIATAFWLAATP